MYKEIEAEYWKDIKGYEGLYQASTLGRIRSIRFWSNVHKKYYNRNKILKPAKTKNGYLMLILCKDGIQTGKKVHNLVAETFIPNPNKYKEINHKDENKENNCIDNLEWCSRKYNMNFGTRGRKVNQYDLDGNFIRTWKNAAEAGKKLDISENSIRYVCRNKLNRAGKFIWKYA